MREWGRKIKLGDWVLVPDGFDEHPDVRYPLVVNPSHSPTQFRAASAAFSPKPPDPKLTGIDRIYTDYSHKLYQDWPSAKMLPMPSIQHAHVSSDRPYAVNPANMGPHGDAIARELIPRSEQKFRGQLS